MPPLLIPILASPALLGMGAAAQAAGLGAAAVGGVLSPFGETALKTFETVQGIKERKRQAKEQARVAQELATKERHQKIISRATALREQKRKAFGDIAAEHQGTLGTIFTSPLGEPQQSLSGTSSSTRAQRNVSLGFA